MRHSKSSHGTFWDKTRIACGLTVKEVGAIMGVGTSTASAYLSGICRPSKTKVAALCERCGVDLTKGYHEFTKAYADWEKEHPGYVRQGNAYKKVEDTPELFGQVPLYFPELEDNVDLSAFNVEAEPKHRGRRKGSPMRITQDNFWFQKKDEKKISFRELSTKVNKPLSTVRNYFIGRMLPDEDTIKAICDYLDVDYTQGAIEFDKIRNARKRRVKTRRKAAVAVTPKVEAVATEAVSPKSSTIDYLELLYGKVSFEEFQLIRTAAKTKEDVLPFVYGQVDYSTYCKIASTL